MPVAGQLVAFAQERVTVGASSIGLTIATFLATPPAKVALISVESAQTRWLDDSTAPTSSTGHVANPTDTLTLDSLQRISNFRAIRTGSTSATLQVTYYR